MLKNTKTKIFLLTSQKYSWRCRRTISTVFRMKKHNTRKLRKSKFYRQLKFAYVFSPVDTEGRSSKCYSNNVHAPHHRHFRNKYYNFQNYWIFVNDSGRREKRKRRTNSQVKNKLTRRVRICRRSDKVGQSASLCQESLALLQEKDAP